MKAYQMIYTACGKDKSGAFSVWAKSANVSKQECDEITRLMNYKKPKNAPYEPTEEEIEKLFPKKYAYFTLSSGRKCVAQSSYIGKVYSDMDNRNGNLIIHAYVFEALDDFNPYYIFNSKLFKDKLTYKEWHDDPLIEDMSSVELNALATPSEMEIKNIVKENKDVFPAFLEALLRIADSGEVVMFNDSESNQAKLYRAVGTLLPIPVLEKITFSSQYALQAEYGLQTVGAIPVKVRNIYENGQGTSFSYEAEIASGKYGFEFEKKLFSKIGSVRRYVTDILNDLEAIRYFDLLKKIDAISDIMRRANCNIDTANAIYNLGKKNYDWFTDIKEFSNSMSQAISIDYVNAQEITLDVYTNAVKKGKWRIDSEILPLLQSIYEYSSIIQKDDIISWFYENIDKFIQPNQDIQTYVSSVKKVIPFSWGDFINNVLSSDKWNNVVLATRDFAKGYLLYTIYIDALRNNLSDKQNIYNNIVVLAKKVLPSRDIGGLELLLDAGKVLGGEFEKRLVDNAWSSIFNTPALDENAMRFGFEVINSFSDTSTQAQYLGKYILENMESQLLIPQYVEYYVANKHLYEKLENSFASKKEFKTFIIKKEAYVFNKEDKITARMLENYFNKFYINGYDHGIYFSKLKEYLDGLQSKDKISECLKQYNLIRRLDDAFCDVIYIIEAIEERIYSVSLEELLKLTASYDSLSEIDRRLKYNARKTSEKYEILYVLLNLTEKLGRRVFVDSLQHNNIYQNLSQSQITFIVEHHSDVILKAYFRAKRENVSDVNLVLNSLLGQPFYIVNKLDKLLIPVIEKLNDRNYYDLMADFFGYAFNQNDKLASEMRRFIEKYIDTMKRSEYKKLFKKIQQTANFKLRAGINIFIIEYQDKHKSLFEKLFGKKKN